jgi:hypothetical protein
MVRAKLEQEINKYLGIPYFINRGKYKNSKDNVFVGKGSAKEIAQTTIELANKEKLKLLDFTPQQLYSFQKKNHLGIDCSGLITHLLNFYFDLNLDPRKTSADMLTSAPLSQKIDAKQATTGDLIRQKNGHHVLFVIEKVGKSLIYVDSSLKNRGVHYGKVSISPPKALYRLVAEVK